MCSLPEQPSVGWISKYSLDLRKNDHHLAGKIYSLAEASATHSSRINCLNSQQTDVHQPTISLIWWKTAVRNIESAHTDTICTQLCHFHCHSYMIVDCIYCCWTKTFDSSHSIGPIILAFSFKKRKERDEKCPIYSNLYVYDCWIRRCVQTCKLSPQEQKSLSH